MQIQYDICINALLLIFLATGSLAQAEQRPNILFFFADDWGRYASIYADADKPSLNDVISTPNIDRIGHEGAVPETLAKLCKSWTRLNVPEPLQ